MLIYVCPCLRWKLNWSNSPFCWYPQRTCCPRYLKIQGQNRPRHCSLKTKSNLETEKYGGINLIVKGDWEQNTKDGERFLTCVITVVLLRESLQRRFSTRLTTTPLHPSLSLPTARKRKENTHYLYRSRLKIEQTNRKVKSETCGYRPDTDIQCTGLVVWVTGVT